MNYQEPATSSNPSIPLKLEVLKSGTIISTMEYQSPKIVFGRLPDCDVVLDHPSSSRYHAVLQFKENDWFIYDMGSAHGTFLNKSKVEAKVYVKVNHGDMVRFGASSRLYIIHGASERSLPETKVPKKSSKPENQVTNYDDDDEMDMRLNGKPIHPSIFLKDPKSVLSTWFDQQGYELNIDFSEQVIQGDHGFIATIQMPVEIISFTAIGKGSKKKEAERDVCLVACKTLSEKGLLVDSEAVLTEAEKRKIRNEMFGDSDNDDDLIYDKTVKKQKTIAKKKPETFESLSEKRLALLSELESISDALHTTEESVAGGVEEEDSLDAFMTSINSQNMQKSRVSLEKRIPALKNELEKIEKLIEIVRPSHLLSTSTNAPAISNQTGFKMPKPVSKSPQKPSSPIIDIDKPRSDNEGTKNDEGPLEKKPIRQYRAMTADESAKHFAIETEEVEEAPDLDYKKKNEITDLNAAYGY